MNDVTEELDAFVGDRRQRIVAAVHDAGRTVTVDELADVVAEWEEERGLTSDWEAIHDHLYEVDLPALEEADLIIFDPEEGVVDTRRTVVGEWQETDESSRPWIASLVVAAVVGVAGTAAFAGVRHGVPLSTLWQVWAAGTVFVLSVTLAVEHTRGYVEKRNG